ANINGLICRSIDNVRLYDESHWQSPQVDVWGISDLDLPLEQAQAAGSRSLEQYNAMRLLDFNIGRLMDIAKAGGYYDNTIFVFFGDHNTRISQI
ncbi:sulfatase-like hydrolase/transferase, partial [Pseudomonas sp. SIMBA_077]